MIKVLGFLSTEKCFVGHGFSTTGLGLGAQWICTQNWI